jgi:hypothetical protein
MTTIREIERVLDAVDWSDAGRNHELEHTLAHLIRCSTIEDAEVEEIQQDEHHVLPITVVRNRRSGDVVWVIADDAATTTLYTDPDLWADAVEDYAQEHGWDADEAPVVATAYERAGVHHTGLQYEPTRAQRIAADSDEAQMRLYRQIRRLDSR